ncbi:hypothetical protein [Verrucomicrobium sp. BvORR106]|uniref:hypothetical protein n=1 Tax=Verrucomicrobium sp. BvORR106 TaxID=1403819 RepID=UPI00056DF4F6|nr:hypothetical protein [Verrucomicrobium sp. BvORR106]
MAFFEYQRLVTAYHGCDQSLVDSALRGIPLNESRNDYDWLGRGIYFWENGPARAMDWAKEVAKRKKTRIAKPSKIGALIQLGNCFDLLDLRFTRYLKTLWPEFEKAMVASGAALPKNTPYLHRLDCAFIDWAIPRVESISSSKFHTVRGVFLEGTPIYPTGYIFEKSHIQIAVRDPASIIGYFVPAGSLDVS